MLVCILWKRPLMQVQWRLHRQKHSPPYSLSTAVRMYVYMCVWVVLHIFDSLYQLMIKQLAVVLSRGLGQCDTQWNCRRQGGVGCKWRCVKCKSEKLIPEPHPTGALCVNAAAQIADGWQMNWNTTIKCVCKVWLWGASHWHHSSLPIRILHHGYLDRFLFPPWSKIRNC